MRATCLLLLGCLVVVGCADGVGTLDEIDPDAAPMQPTYALHIAPIMDQHCTACHAVDAQPGELAGRGYDTCDKVRLGWSSIVSTAFDGESMPPGGADRVPEAHRLTMRRWWDQGAVCP